MDAHPPLQSGCSHNLHEVKTEPRPPLLPLHEQHKAGTLGASPRPTWPCTVLLDTPLHASVPLSGRAGPFCQNHHCLHPHVPWLPHAPSQAIASGCKPELSSQPLRARHALKTSVPMSTWPWRPSWKAPGCPYFCSANPVQSLPQAPVFGRLSLTPSKSGSSVMSPESPHRGL